METIAQMINQIISSDMVKIIKSFVRGRIIGETLIGRDYLGENLIFIYPIVLAAAPYTGIFMLRTYFFDCFHFLSGKIFYLVLLIIASIISFVLKRQGFYAKTKEEVENMSIEEMKKCQKQDGIVVIFACSMYIVPVAIIIVHALLTQ